MEYRPRPPAGKTPEAREIVQCIVRNEEAALRLSERKNELLQEQADEDVEKEGATKLRMKLQDLWRSKGAKVAQREIHRLLAFAGFDPIRSAAGDSGAAPGH